MTAPNGPQVYLAEAPPPLEPHGLTALRRDDLSVVHFAAPVHDTKIAHAAMSLLWALGKREGVTGVHGNPSENVPLVPIWLSAYRTHTVIISAAQHWNARLTQEMVRLLMSAGTTVVLVADHGRLDHIEDTAAGFLPTTVPFDDLQTLFPPPVASQRTNAIGYDWLDTPLPEADWPTFRSECRRLLPQSAFAELNDHYLRALHTTRARLDDQLEAVTDDTTRTLLIDLLADTDHSIQATAVLRAVQAAYFAVGWNLRVDVHEAVSLIAQSRAIAFTARDWRSLRAYREPGRAAACVLYGAELPVSAIEALTLADMDSALTTGTIHGFALCEEALAVLRAAHLERSLDGADATDLFIVCSRVATMLTNAAKDLGILVASTANRRSEHTANFWQWRLGFTMQRMN